MYNVCNNNESTHYSLQTENKKFIVLAADLNVGQDHAIPDLLYGKAWWVWGRPPTHHGTTQVKGRKNAPKENCRKHGLGWGAVGPCPPISMGVVLWWGLCPPPPHSPPPTGLWGFPCSPCPTTGRGVDENHSNAPAIIKKKSHFLTFTQIARVPK